MPINIDTTSSEITSKIDALLPLLRAKYKQSTDSIPAVFGSLEALTRSVDLMRALSPVNAIRSSAEGNVSSINPKPLDLTELNASKHQLLNRLFFDESKLQPDDFPESQREAYRSTSQVRGWLRPLDYMLSFVTKYRILDYYFKLPKTTIALAWDALEASVHEYNDTLNLLNNDEKLKFKHTLVHQYIVKGKTITAEVPTEILSSILSYLEPEQLVEISHDHALSRSFDTKTILNDVLPQLKVNGFKESVFIYINPLALFWNKTLQHALTEVLAEGYHVSLFKTINPERLFQTPRFDVPNMPEIAEEGAVNNFNTKAWWLRRGDYIDYLTPDIFPDSCRAIRGMDGARRPFISVLNGKNNVVTFFQRYSNDKHTWVTGSNHGEGELQNSGHLNLEKTKESVEQIEYYFPNSKETVHASYTKYQEWKSLFLAYMNISCPQQDGQPCNLDMLKSISNSLMYIIEDEYRLVDRAEYPDLDLPRERPDSMI